MIPEFHPELKELRKLACFVLDPLDFKQRHGKLLSILFVDVVEGLLSVLVWFYDPLYRCFTFPDYQLVPTLEEYAHLLGIPVSSKVPFSGLEEIPRSHHIVEALHLKKSEIKAHWVKKGALFGNSKGGGTIVCCIPLLYKWFILHLPQTPTFVEKKQRLRWSQRLLSLTNDDIVWYDPSLSSLEIIDSCGEFSIVPLIGTQGGINYPALARRQLGFPLRDKPNNTQLEALEAYTLWVKKRDLELKMLYPIKRPISMVVVEPLTLPNQDIEELEDALAKMKRENDMCEERFHALNKKHEELQLESKDKDVLIELLEDRVTKRQRESEVSSSYSMPQPSVSWKKIVEQLVLDKTRMKASFESEIRRIRRKTVNSEIAISTVPVTAAHFVSAMPAGFPWGMPPNFVPEGFAHTFASMPASSPVMSVPPPIVHTLPRVEDTIYHSEPSEGPDVYEKMDEMKDQFLELRKELKTLRGKDLFWKSAAELCLVPNVKIPVKFKVPDLEKIQREHMSAQSFGDVCSQNVHPNRQLSVVDPLHSR
ncbi:hypothetical protein KIW84_062430 [Lathyrus oleraceus]|uniref:DUF7745 domain-containing protein n=1 Tax=Pisum sativum TaxID=3888 RepID=A0A9D5A3K2_PEA|nr:hypothetical protein KIW84_062430 [Pisum sativum]